MYVGPSLFYAKRVIGSEVCMYKKGWVDWKGLTFFNNQISFFVQGVCKFSTLLPKCPCLCTLDPVSYTVEEFLDVCPVP